MPLTDPKVRQAKPAEKPYKLPDEKGLFLLVNPNGSKYWRFRYRFQKKEKTLSIGVYPEISLKQARDDRDIARMKLRDNIDPSQEKQEIKQTEIKVIQNSFKNISGEWYEKVKVKWSDTHSARVKKILENELWPEFGGMDISEIGAPELIAAIRKIEDREAFETAKKSRRVAGQVFRYGIALGLCRFDPSASIGDAMTTTVTKHMASITDPKEVGRLLVAIDNYYGTPTVQHALKISPLLFQRPGEIRHMEWAEIDFDNARWDIPAHKMKMRVEHTVPLSRQAIEILRKQQELNTDSPYVFPNPRSKSRPMSENAVRVALRTAGFGKDEITSHGFRAMARTLLDEVLQYRVDWIEHQLAHAVKDATGRAYNRTKHLEGRREMMQAWADYLDSLREQALMKNVVPVNFNKSA